MKQTRILRLLTRLAVVLPLLGLAIAPRLKAQFECKQELMAGAWVHHGDELDVLGIEGSPLEALAGPFSEVGISVFDEQGRATAAFQTNTTVSGASRADFLADDRPGGPLDIHFVINSDCTGRWIFTDRASGAPLFEFVTVCANGQRECWATWVSSFGNTTPPDFNGIVTLKRVGTFEQQQAEDIAFLKDLTKRIAAVLGVLRREDDAK